MAHCKPCRNSASTALRAERDGAADYRALLAKNPEGYKARSRAYYEANRERAIERSAARRKADPERAKRERKAEYQAGKAEALQRARRWATENPERRKEIARAHAAKVYADPEKRALIIARKLLSRVLECTGRKKRGRTFDQLGYNRQELEQHLEKLFEPDMTWSNHGEWHVDHVTPVSELVKAGVTDPKRINALANLQPLWALHNLCKGVQVPADQSLFPELHR